MISKYTIFHPSAVNGGAAGALSLIAEHKLKFLYKFACYMLLCRLLRLKRLGLVILDELDEPIAGRLPAAQLYIRQRV